MNFNNKVYELVSRIPKGKVTTYKILAEKLGNINLARAVGNALNKNPNLIKTPCHRVIRSDSRIGGYKNGTKEKIKLLIKEGIAVKEGKVIDFKKIVYK